MEECNGRYYFLFVRNFNDCFNCSERRKKMKIMEPAIVREWFNAVVFGIPLVIAIGF